MFTPKSQTRRRNRRAGSRGTAMLEAIIVISVFILFLVGMIYFRHLYEQQLAVMRLSRAAAVSYAMNGCNGGPTDSIQKDLVGTTIVVESTGTPSGTTHIGSNPSTNPKVGKSSGTPVSSALGHTGLDEDKIANDTLSTTAAAGSPETAMFKATVKSTSYMTCGEQRKDGNAEDLLSDIAGLFGL
jgi:hypothetical protein